MRRQYLRRRLMCIPSIQGLAHYIMTLASGTREGDIVLNFHSLSNFLLSTTFD